MIFHHNPNMKAIVLTKDFLTLAAGLFWPRSANLSTIVSKKSGMSIDDRT